MQNARVYFKTCENIKIKLKYGVRDPVEAGTAYKNRTTI